MQFRVFLDDSVSVFLAQDEPAFVVVHPFQSTPLLAAIGHATPAFCF